MTKSTIVIFGSQTFGEDSPNKLYYGKLLYQYLDCENKKNHTKKEPEKKEENS